VALAPAAGPLPQPSAQPQPPAPAPPAPPAWGRIGAGDWLVPAAWGGDDPEYQGQSPVVESLRSDGRPLVQRQGAL